MMGLLYNKGLGMQVDREQAIFWFEKAAAQGEELAIEALAKLKNN